MRKVDHPGRRPTRFHWAAGLNPAHWLVALVLWGGIFTAGIGSAFSEQLALTVPWLLALALAYSGFWLIVVPNNPRFRRAIDAKLGEQYAHDYAFQLADLGERVHPDLQDKVQDMSRLRDRARAIMTTKFGEHDLFARDNLDKLDTLAISYLQLLVALTEYDEYLSLVNPDTIERELATSKQTAEVNDPVLREARLKQVELLESRLQRYHKAAQRLELLQAQARNVETTLKLLIDQAMTAPDAQRVGRDIDQVLANIRESETLTAELATFDDLERELDDTRLRERE